MTLADFITKIQAKLVAEAGSSDWWTVVELKSWANDLYRETARDLECIKGRDTTAVTVALQRSYDIVKITNADTILSLLEVTHKGIPVEPVSLRSLNRDVYNWRATVSAAVPYGWYFEPGNERKTVSFYPPTANASEEIGFEYTYVPIELGNTDHFIDPFYDGLIMLDGVLAIALAKSGGGRDLDRSDFYWAQFVGKIQGLKKEAVPMVHVFGSVEDSSLTRRSGVRLPSNYPSYSFE